MAKIRRGEREGKGEKWQVTQGEISTAIRVICQTEWDFSCPRLVWHFYSSRVKAWEREEESNWMKRMKGKYEWSVKSSIKSIADQWKPRHWIKWYRKVWKKRRQEMIGLECGASVCACVSLGRKWKKFKSKGLSRELRHILRKTIWFLSLYTRSPISPPSWHINAPSKDPWVVFNTHWRTLSRLGEGKES